MPLCIGNGERVTRKIESLFEKVGIENPKEETRTYLNMGMTTVDLWKDVVAKRARHECFRCGKHNDNITVSDVCSTCRALMIHGVSGVDRTYGVDRT